MSTPPAGWYPDPAMPQTQRYWDGVNWTVHVAPLNVPSPPSDHGPNTPEHWLVPVGRSWQSIVAGYLGIVSLLFALLAYAGLVVGAMTIGISVWALAAARSGGHGRGRAIFGLVCGIIAVIGGVLTAVYVY